MCTLVGACWEHCPLSNGVFLLLGGFAPNRRQLRRTSAARFALLGLNAQTLHHWLLFGRAAANRLAEKAAARESLKP